MFGLHMGRMGGTGRVGGAPIWAPAANFASGESGLWYDPSTFTGLYQDSAGTSPATAVGQPNGLMLDKSGRNNHISQATASARPLIGATGAIQYTTFDGLDDGMSTGAITLGSDMDCFIAVRRNSAAGSILFSGGGGSNYAGYCVSGATASTFDGAGTPTLAIDGVDQAVITGGAVHTAMAVGAWHVFEARNMNLTAWTVFQLTQYQGGFRLNGDIAGVILCPAGDAAARQKNRQWLGNKVGLVLP